jgi:hypothetical protein
MYKSSALGAASGTLILRAEKKRFVLNSKPARKRFLHHVYGGCEHASANGGKDAAISIALMLEIQRRLELTGNRL